MCVCVCVALTLLITHTHLPFSPLFFVQSPSCFLLFVSVVLSCLVLYSYGVNLSNIYIYIYIYLVKVANLAVECSMPYIYIQLIFISGYVS